MGAWDTLLRMVGLRAETAVEAPRLIEAGIGIATGQSFSTPASLSAMATFPWVRACVDAISEDLAGLPLVAKRGGGSEAVRVDLPPDLKKLLYRPTSSMGRYIWERQISTYLWSSGNAYILRAGVRPERPDSLPLLHPEGVRVIANAAGQVEAYEFRPHGGSPVIYAASVVIHLRLPNWEPGAAGLVGEGSIRPLALDLASDQAAAKLSKNQSGQGRPSAIFIPKDGVRPTKEQGDALMSAYSQLVAENRPGMMLPAGFDVQLPAFTLRDLEYASQRALTRESVLAVFGVPPARVGLPNANYATQQQQSQTYWRGLVAKARVLDEAYTAIAAGWDPEVTITHDFSQVEELQPGRDARLQRVLTWTMLGASPAEAAAYEGFDDAPVGEAAAEQPMAQAVNARGRVLRAGEDFASWWSSKPAALSLAPSTKELDPESPRLEQSEYERPPHPYVADLKENWPEIWDAGGNIRGNEAYEYWSKYVDGDRSEGVLAWVAEREAWAARHYEDGDAFTGENPENPTLSNIGGVVAWLKWGVIGQLGWDRIQDLMRQLKADVREQRRAVTWRAWLEEVHLASEVSLQRRTAEALRIQRRAIEANLEAAWPLAEQRDLTDLVSAIVEAIFPASVADMLLPVVKDAYRNGVRAAYARAARQVGSALSPERVDPVANQLLAIMVAQVNGATRDMLSVLVSEGISQGLTVNDMQQKIQVATGFSPSRALRIARTETTRSVNAGSTYAWQTVAADTGVTIRREWLSARDSVVREEHADLDGQIVELGGQFVVPSGPYAGRKGSGPGDFDAAALVVNCRCTVLPIVEQK